VIPPFVTRLIERLPPLLRPPRSLLVYGPVQALVYVAEYAAFLALVDGGRHVALANVLSKLLALVLGYAAHAVWTFEGKLSDDPYRRAGRFLLVFAANTLLSTLALLALKSLLPVAVAKPVADLAMGLFTYLALRIFVFAERPKTD
jgi:putative flippase GtrA